MKASNLISCPVVTSDVYEMNYSSRSTAREYFPVFADAAAPASSFELTPANLPYGFSKCVLSHVLSLLVLFGDTYHVRTS